MVKSKNMFSGLTSLPNAIEKDVLDPDKIPSAHRWVKAAEAELAKALSARKQAYAEDNQEKGIPPAYFRAKDLSEIMTDVLLSGSPISKAFDKRERTHFKGWAKRTIGRSPSRKEFAEAITRLDTPAASQIQLMKDQKMFDMKEWGSASTYRQGLNRMKKQLAIAKRFAQKDEEIRQLKAQNKVLTSGDPRTQAMQLSQQGLKVAQIAKQLGISRTTVYKYLKGAGQKIP